MARRRIEKKRVIITGASSGIGWHLAKQLAAENALVVVCGRRENLLNRLASEIEAAGGTCTPIAGDVTNSEFRKRLVDSCVEMHGGIDVLINNAGIGAMGRFDEASEDRLRKVFEVNFFAVAELTRIAIPELSRGNDPIIVNINSVLGHRATPLKSEYCASKFAVHGLSDAIRAELAPLGIETLLVSPSTTDSEFFSQAIEDTTNKDWKRGGAMAPEVVAQKAILAMKKRRSEIILTLGGRFLVWLDRILPGLANKLVARFGQ